MKKTIPWAGALSLLLWFGTAGAGMPPFVPPLVSCPLVTDAPVIDGSLDDPAWGLAARVGDFRTTHGDRRAGEQTEVFLCYDKENLYLAIRCFDSRMDLLKVRETRRDGPVFWDDSIELFLDPDLTRKHFLQFIVNPAGVLFDQKVTEITELDWNAEGVIATTIGPDSWIVEWAIPFAKLGMEAPEPGDRWGFNLARTTWRLMEYSCWSPTGTDRFQVPERFGDILFSARPGIRVSLGEADTRETAIEGAVTGGEPRHLRLDFEAFSSEGTTHGTTRDLPPEAFGEQRRWPYRLPPGWDDFHLRVSVLEADGEEVAYRSPALPVHASADARLQMAREEMARLKADIMLLQASAPRREYVLAPAHPFRTHLPWDKPDVGTVGQPVLVSGCPGEYLSAAVLLYTGRDLSRVKVFLESDLCNGEHAIPRDAVDIRILKRWFQGGAGQRYFRPTLVPELLLKNDALISIDAREQLNHIHFEGIPEDGPELERFNVAAYSNKKIWLTIHVPEGTPAGRYRTRIRVAPENAAGEAIPIEIRVLPFELLDPGKLYTAYYYSPRMYHYGDSPEVLVAELEDMRAHGFNAAPILSYDTGFSAAENGGWQVDWNDLEREIELRQQAGLHGPIILGLQTHRPPFPTRLFRGPWAPDHAPELGEAQKMHFLIQALTTRARERQWPPIYILGIDEPNFDSSGAMLERCRKLFEIIKDADELAGTTTAIDIEGAKQLGASLDLPLYNAFSAYRRFLDPEPGKKGKTELVYWHPLENPVHDRFHFGLMVWRARLDGAVPYAYRHVYQGDPYRVEDSRDQRRGERNSMYTYPSRTGPIPTIQWESARQGINDVRYLRTLEYWADYADSQTGQNGDLEQATARARMLLAIPLEDPPDYYAFLENLTPSFFDALRQQVIDAVLDLKDRIGKAGPVAVHDE